VSVAAPCTATGTTAHAPGSARAPTLPEEP
jgi:hypothetical protein